VSDILHRLTIKVPPEHVHEMVATKTGLERWWSGNPVGGDENVGDKLLIYFGGDQPAAIMEIVENTSDTVAWRCVSGPSDWQGTEIVYSLTSSDDHETTMLFSHAGWRDQNEFMHHCSTHWASYLIGLKAGLEGENFTPFPQGEVNHWP
jgi:uncharacterized protein YndB with AHSA1/START domain